MSDSSYVCPNGHEFPAIVAVPCGECDATVTCEPASRGMALHTEVERLRAAITAHHDVALRRGIQTHDRALWRAARRFLPVIERRRRNRVAVEFTPGELAAIRGALSYFLEASEYEEAATVFGAGGGMQAATRAFDKIDRAQRGA